MAGGQHPAALKALPVSLGGRGTWHRRSEGPPVHRLGPGCSPCAPAQPVQMVGSRPREAPRTGGIMSHLCGVWPVATPHLGPQVVCEMKQNSCSLSVLLNSSPREMAHGCCLVWGPGYSLPCGTPSASLACFSMGEMGGETTERGPVGPRALEVRVSRARQTLRRRGGTSGLWGAGGSPGTDRGLREEG